MKASVSIGSDGFVKNNNGHVEIARQKWPTGVNFENWLPGRNLPGRFPSHTLTVTRSKVKLTYDISEENMHNLLRGLTS